MKKDIEIAHSTPLKRIEDVAAGMGIAADELEHYGKHIAKLPLSLISEDKQKHGKLILHRPRPRLEQNRQARHSSTA